MTFRRRLARLAVRSRLAWTHRLPASARDGSTTMLIRYSATPVPERIEDHAKQVRKRAGRYAPAPESLSSERGVAYRRRGKVRRGGFSRTLFRLNRACRAEMATVRYCQIRRETRMVVSDMPDPSWASPLVIVGLLHAAIIAVAAAVAGGIAIWRLRVADKALRFERYHQAAGFLGNKGSGLVARFFGATALWDIAKDQPKEFHVRVMQVYASYLAYPARYQGGELDGKHDPTSPETEMIVELINTDKSAAQRAVEQEENYKLNLYKHSPYTTDENGKVVDNPDHWDYPFVHERGWSGKEAARRSASMPSPPSPESGLFRSTQYVNHPPVHKA